MHFNQTVQIQRRMFSDKNFMTTKNLEEQQNNIDRNAANSRRSRKNSAEKLNSKVKQSVQLLSNRLLNISEVAYSLEFKDPKYFSKCFKKEFGMTPREYRDALINNNDSDEDVNIDENFIGELTNKIMENLSFQHFSVDELADKLNVSYSNLYRKVKANIGVTPGDFIRKIRIHQAKDLLDLENFSISDIAFNTGFSNTQYFNQCFKSELGLFPAEYIGSRRILKNIG